MLWLLCLQSAVSTSSGPATATKGRPPGIGAVHVGRCLNWPGSKTDNPHRFRDAFAVELLLSGVLLERVSVLLGHTSIKVTEKHYAPWIRARPEQLEADLERCWATDPMVPTAAKGTPEVHGQKEAVN